MQILTLRDSIHIIIASGWVVRFYASLARKPDEAFSSDEKAAYLRSLAVDHEDWQVKQADHALRLYLHYLHTILPHAGATGSNEAWQHVGDEVRRIARLRYLSLATEQTYLGWLRQFCAFVKQRPPADLGLTDVEDFLSYLAVVLSVQEVARVFAHLDGVYQ